MEFSKIPPQAAGAGRIDFEGELNAQQLAAVTSGPGYSLVIAGAGSGKTRTLTYRVAWLLEQGIPAHSILLLTFTNKAAREMAERVHNLLPGAADGLWAGTFHSIGNKILRLHAEDAGFRPGFSIMDREDSEDMLASVLQDDSIVGGNRRFPKAGVLSDIFSLAVNTVRPVSKILAEKYRYFIPLAQDIEKVQCAYESRKREANSLDFDDLLSKPLALFQQRPDIAARYQGLFRHILVDEYQDTNRLQGELVEVLAARHGNVMVVGDDAQSIYSWRGADFENILRFPEKHAGSQVFRIETNYRSVPAILALANAAILPNEKQFAKMLEPVRGNRVFLPALVATETNTDQAGFIARRVTELIEEGIPPGEIAVLYRAHYHSMEVQIEFTRRGIPFSITSGIRFFEQAHVKDVAAFLKLAVNPRDETSFRRIVRLLPGIGEKTAESLWQRVSARLGGKPDFRLLEGAKVPAKAEKSWAQLVHTLCDLVPESGVLPPADMISCVMFAVYEDYMKTKFPNYEARREDLETLQAFASQFQDTAEFLAQLALLGGLETQEALAPQTDNQRVTLSTLHQAKGLEWKVVFLVWLADGMFPIARSLEDDGALEEERRLFYVGITRCMDQLYMTYPQMRLGTGHGNPFQSASRFLQDLPQELYETWEPDADFPLARDMDEEIAGEDPF